jgi:hypothetical protein
MGNLEKWGPWAGLYPCSVGPLGQALQNNISMVISAMQAEVAQY